jgi:hypothetical protein
MRLGPTVAGVDARPQGIQPVGRSGDRTRVVVAIGASRSGSGASERTRRERVQIPGQSALHGAECPGVVRAKRRRVDGGKPAGQIESEGIVSPSESREWRWIVRPGPAGRSCHVQPVPHSTQISVDRLGGSNGRFRRGCRRMRGGAGPGDSTYCEDP